MKWLAGIFLLLFAVTLWAAIPSGGGGIASDWHMPADLIFDDTVWDDMRGPATNARVPAANGPDLDQFPTGDGSSNIKTYCFPDGSDTYLFYDYQIPHGYKLETDLYPHLHWAPSSADTGNVAWEFEYTIGNVSGTMANAATLTLADAGDGTQDKHQLAAFSAISGTGLGISAAILARIMRDGNGGSDTFTGKACLMDLDIHFEKDTVGSDTSTVK
jgi:hypothetical protein